MTKFGNREQRENGSLLRVPAVRRLVVAYAGSALGSGILGVAIAFAAYQESSRSLVLTVVALSANALPAFFLAPLVGRLATRRDPRSVDALGRVAKIVQMSAMAAFAFTGDLTYVILVVSGLVNGSISALTSPAWPAVTRMAAPKDRLPELTAFFPSISAVAAIVGALVGGVVVATLGLGWAFTFNALSFLPMIAAVRAIPGTDQPVFFVATAPADGRINLSPKGLDTFTVLDPRTVAYLDLTGSGVETIAHLRENGRITLMFCAFAGKPNIVRLYGRGEALRVGEPEADTLADRFPSIAGARSVIRVAVDRVATSCGYGVPLLEYQGPRTRLVEWAETKGADGLIAYRAEKNAASIDGLPGLAPQ